MFSVVILPKIYNILTQGPSHHRIIRVMLKVNVWKKQYMGKMKIIREKLPHFINQWTPVVAMTQE